MISADAHAATLTAGEPPKIGEKFAVQTFGPFDLDDLRRYAIASGDDNPIHLDPSLAERAGLKAPPVHGMLLMGRFEAALEIWRPDLQLITLASKFLRPIFLGERVEISGRVAQVTPGKGDEQTKFVLRLMMHNERREIALLAEATTIRKMVS